jgi:hypothetical protein
MIFPSPLLHELTSIILNSEAPRGVRGLECSGRRSRTSEDHIGLQTDQLLREYPQPVNIPGGPANIHPQVAAFSPTQLGKSLREPGEASLSLRIVFVECQEHADPPHAVGLLRPRRERPRRHPA